MRCMNSEQQRFLSTDALRLPSARNPDVAARLRTGCPPPPVRLQRHGLADNLLVDVGEQSPRRLDAPDDDEIFTEPGFSTSPRELPHLLRRQSLNLHRPL